MLGFRVRLRRRIEKLHLQPSKVHPRLEELETRTLLSTTLIPAGVPNIVAHPDLTLLPTSVTNPTQAQLPPNSIRLAYGINSIQFQSGGTFIKGNGAGQTIAIVDGYNDPNIKSDLATFDNYFGLQAPPSFTQLNENGGTSLAGIPNSPGLGSNGSTWALEESLDVEWSHVIAPAANIVVFQANSGSDNDLAIAVQTAATASTYTNLGLPVAGVISNSYGEFEGTDPNQDATQALEQYQDTTFYGPISQANDVTLLFSSGDQSVPIYPSTSPYVTSVGGTSLSLKLSPFGVVYNGESAWSAGGGGTSLYEPEPAYQTNYGLSNSDNLRQTPDIAMDADPNTGVYITDTYDFPSQTPVVTQYSIGGTSLASPLWAGFLAIVNQGRALQNEGPLANAQVAVYNLPESDFHDVTTGHNGSGIYAGAGYDEVTGLGTPTGSLLVNALVNSSSQPVGLDARLEAAGVQGPLTGPKAGVAGAAFSIDAQGTTEAAVGIATANALATTDVAGSGREVHGLMANSATVVLPATSAVQRIFATPNGVASPLVATAYLEDVAGIPDAADSSAVPADFETPSDRSDGAVDLHGGNTTGSAVLTQNGAAETPGTEYVIDMPLATFDGPVARLVPDSAAPERFSDDKDGSIDPTILAGVALALGGSWSGLIQNEEVRSRPALNH